MTSSGLTGTDATIQFAAAPLELAATIPAPAGGFAGLIAQLETTPGVVPASPTPALVSSVPQQTGDGSSLVSEASLQGVASQSGGDVRQASLVRPLPKPSEAVRGSADYVVRSKPNSIIDLESAPDPDGESAPDGVETRRSDSAEDAGEGRMDDSEHSVVVPPMLAIVPPPSLPVTPTPDASDAETGRIEVAEKQGVVPREYARSGAGNSKLAEGSTPVSKLGSQKADRVSPAPGSLSEVARDVAMAEQGNSGTTPLIRSLPAAPVPPVTAKESPVSGFRSASKIQTADAVRSPSSSGRELQDVKQLVPSEVSEAERPKESNGNRPLDFTKQAARGGDKPAFWAESLGEAVELAASESFAGEARIDSHAISGAQTGLSDFPTIETDQKASSLRPATDAKGRLVEALKTPSADTPESTMGVFGRGDLPLATSASWKILGATVPMREVQEPALVDSARLPSVKPAVQQGVPMETKAVEQDGRPSSPSARRDELPIGSDHNPSVPAVASVGQARLARQPSSETGSFGGIDEVSMAPASIGNSGAERPEISENGRKTASISPETPDGSGKAGRPIAAVKQPGTPAASQTEAMCFDGHQQEIAGLKRPGRTEREFPSSRLVGVEMQASAPIQPQPQTDPLVNRDSLPSSLPSDVRRPMVANMDRLAELVTVEATILRQFKPGALTAVVRPDASSELRLELRLNRGQVEAQAVLEKGDLHAFAGGWEELQKSLRAQGIQLQPLVEMSSRPSTDLSGDGQRRQTAGGNQNEPESKPWSIGGLPEVLRPAVAGIAARVSPATGGTRHLLESWA
jgi:hypothetical protein